MKVFVALFLFVLLSFPNSSYAQYASTKDAQYIATLAAVMNFKIDDEEFREDLEELRENENFIRKLQKKMDKLSNEKNPDATNRKVIDILKQAGKELDRLL